MLESNFSEPGVFDALNVSTMENSIAVANYFVDKAQSDSIELTPMKLVKLVYIAHGWNLAIKGEPLFDEDIQAWKYGPVVTTVYYRYRHYGSSQIKGKEEEDFMIVDGKLQARSGFLEVQNHNSKEILDRVWNVYNKYSGLELSALTHKRGTPWDIAYNTLGGKNVQGFPIPNELIRAHYVDLINERRRKQGE